MSKIITKTHVKMPARNSFKTIIQQLMFKIQFKTLSY